jgi:hypothetical protein
MGDRELLGWAACVALGGGVLLVARPLLILLSDDLGRFLADPVCLLGLGVPAALIMVCGLAAWRTGPGKVAGMAGGMILFALVMILGSGFHSVLDGTLAGASIAAVLAMACGGSAWRTRPGQVAMIGSVFLLAAALLVFLDLLIRAMGMD